MTRRLSAAGTELVSLHTAGTLIYTAQLEIPEAPLQPKTDIRAAQER